MCWGDLGVKIDGAVDQCRRQSTAAAAAATGMGKVLIDFLRIYGFSRIVPLLFLRFLNVILTSGVFSA